MRNHGVHELLPKLQRRLCGIHHTLELLALHYVRQRENRLEIANQDDINCCKVDELETRQPVLQGLVQQHLACATTVHNTRVCACARCNSVRVFE